MPVVEFDCPHCGYRMSGTESVYGTTLACPSCKGAIIVPRTTGAVPGARVAVLAPSGAPGDEAPRPPECDVFVVRPAMKSFWFEMLLGILLAPVAVGLLLILHVWLRKMSVQYRLTNQRLFVRRGLIGRTLEEVELFRVKDVTLTQSIPHRLLGCGNVTVLSTDDSRPRVDIAGVDGPDEIKEFIRENVRASRRREAVRSAEFIQS